MLKRRMFISVSILVTMVLVPLASSSVLSAQAAGKTAQAAGGNVLILSTTVTNDSLSLEAQAAISLGLNVTVADPSTWATMTTSDFARYQAIILGDPTCQTDPSALSAAEATTSAWGPAITGNVLVIGTDPVYHVTYGPGQVGAQELINNGIAFVTSTPGRTGAYIDLSCYYSQITPPSSSPVPVLDGIVSGGFSVVGQQAASGGCPENSHIVATSPVVANMTDADLSNWSCSTHEAFTTWPSSFQVLAISTDIPSSFTAPDGTNGAPYILASGAKWGVDSADTITSSFYNQITQTFGVPDFFGRYIGDPLTSFQPTDRNPCARTNANFHYRMSKEEVGTVHRLGLAILPIYFSFRLAQVKTYACGQNYATAAIEFAQRAPGFAISQGTAIFVDIEASAQPDSAFIQGWFDTFNKTFDYTSPYDGKTYTYQAGYYQAGYYANTLPTAYFDTAFCSAVSQEAAVGTNSFIWTTQPDKGSVSGSTTRKYAPAYQPFPVPCLNQQTPAAWQYRINNKEYPVNVDLDEALSSLPLWRP